MKRIIFPALLCMAFVGCANVEVKKTYVASGATSPRSIYIRPFDITETVFTGDHGPEGEHEIRKSLAPAELDIALKAELSKIAPTMVLKNTEIPEKGWIIEGDIDLVDGGNRSGRFWLGHFGVGATRAIVHVKVLDAAVVDAGGDGKGGESPAVLYAFDVESSSNASGPAGTVYSSGVGTSEMFDYRNIAEKVSKALTPDPYKYGERGGFTDR